MYSLQQVVLAIRALANEQDRTRFQLLPMRRPHVPTLFAEAMVETSTPTASRFTQQKHGIDLHATHHVTITPTGMFLEGPDAEQSNRVLRLYPDNPNAFLRVTFAEVRSLGLVILSSLTFTSFQDDHLSFRFDPDCDSVAFVHDRFGEVLKRGVTVGGQRFEFLGVS